MTIKADVVLDRTALALISELCRIPDTEFGEPETAAMSFSAERLNAIQKRQFVVARRLGIIKPPVVGDPIPINTRKAKA